MSEQTKRLDAAHSETSGGGAQLTAMATTMHLLELSRRTDALEELTHLDSVYQGLKEAREGKLGKPINPMDWLADDPSPPRRTVSRADFNALVENCAKKSWEETLEGAKQVIEWCFTDFATRCGITIEE